MGVEAPISAIVLAGGRARRLGGQDKGLIELSGRRLIAHTLERIAPQVDEVLISANRHLDVYAAWGLPVVPDELPGFRGPLAGIVAAGRLARHDWLLTVPCDPPFLPHDLAARLLAAALGQNVRLARARDPNRVHYLVMLLHRSLFADLAAELGRAGTRSRIGRQGTPAPRSISVLPTPSSTSTRPRTWPWPSGSPRSVVPPTRGIGYIEMGTSRAREMFFCPLREMRGSPLPKGE